MYQERSRQRTISAKLGVRRHNVSASFGPAKDADTEESLWNPRGENSAVTLDPDLCMNVGKAWMDSEKKGRQPSNVHVKRGSIHAKRAAGKNLIFNFNIHA